MAEMRSTPTLAGGAIRQVLGIVVLAAAGSLAQNLPVPPLPYPYGSLVPFISEHALRVSPLHNRLENIGCNTCPEQRRLVESVRTESTAGERCAGLFGQIWRGSQAGLCTCRSIGLA